MPKSNLSGWRGFSTLAQVNLATVQPVDTLFFFDGEPIEPEPETFYANDTEITGELLPTVTRLLNKKMGFTHKGKATPHLVGVLASQVMGKCTTTQIGVTTAYQHKLEIDKSVVELPARTCIENDGDAQFLYRGIAVTGFKLTGSRGQFVEFEATCVGSGDEAADATAKPPRLIETYMAYGEAKLSRGGVYNGTAVTGGTDISAKVLDFTVELKNNGKGVYFVGDPSGNVGSIRRGTKYEATLEANLEIEDRSDRAALLAGTEYVFSIPIVGSIITGANRYTIEVICPAVVYREAKKGLNEGILKVNAKFQVKSHPTYGAMIINLINTHQESYLATA